MLARSTTLSKSLKEMFDGNNRKSKVKKLNQFKRPLELQRLSRICKILKAQYSFINEPILADVVFQLISFIEVERIDDTMDMFD